MRQLVSKIWRYIKLYLLLIKFSLMWTFVYRADTLFMALTPIAWFLGTIVFISVIFKGVSQVGGWSYWEIMFLLGIHEFVFLISWTFFNNNLNDFSGNIRLGKFDRDLLLPVNKKFLISFSQIDLTGIGSLLNVIVVLLLSLKNVILDLSLIRIFSFVISLFSAILTFYLISFILSTMSLFLVKAEVFFDWLVEMTDFDRFPAEIYSSWLRRFLLIGLPILFLAYIPAGIILGKVSCLYAGAGIVVDIWLYILSNILWKKGLKKYQSVST